MKFQLYLHRFLLIQTLPGAMDHLPPVGFTRGVRPACFVKEAFAIMHHRHNHSLGFALSHHHLIVYEKALELLAAVGSSPQPHCTVRLYVMS